MITARVTTIRVNTGSLFAPGGDVNRWSKTAGRELQVQAKAKAPPRHSESRWHHQGTGKLNAGIKGFANRVGTRQMNIVVFSSASYSKYVLRGTAGAGAGYIYTTKGYANQAQVDRWIDSGRGPRKGERGWHMRTPIGPLMRVQGQLPNPFLTDAYDAVRRHHDALPRLPV